MFTTITKFFHSLTPIMARVTELVIEEMNSAQVQAAVHLVLQAVQQFAASALQQGQPGHDWVVSALRAQFPQLSLSQANMIVEIAVRLVSRGFAPEVLPTAVAATTTSVAASTASGTATPSGTVAPSGTTTNSLNT